MTYSARDVFANQMIGDVAAISAGGKKGFTYPPFVMRAVNLFVKCLLLIISNHL